MKRTFNYCFVCNKPNDYFIKKAKEKRLISTTIRFFSKKSDELHTWLTEYSGNKYDEGFSEFIKDLANSLHKNAHSVTLENLCINEYTDRIKFDWGNDKTKASKTREVIEFKGFLHHKYQKVVSGIGGSFITEHTAKVKFTLCFSRKNERGWIFFNPITTKV